MDMTVSRTDVEAVAGGPVAALVVGIDGDETAVYLIKKDGTRVMAGAVGVRIECAANAHRTHPTCNDLLSMQPVDLDAILSAIQ